jgi:NADPH-dependent 2,4-dienoyl-CoA reductase/sulfur reductase-like enzyme/nitrite reductase/ring-hydroxylating ferredoxin subunit
MSEHNERPAAPDFRQGVAVGDLTDGAVLQGCVDNRPALLVRRGTNLFAVGATCTHYGGPLAEGLVVGDTVRCPWHHACFSLRTGAPLRPPALNALPCWQVVQQGGMAFVRDAIPQTAPPVLSVRSVPVSVAIIGGGAAGHAAAETLRQEGFAGEVTVVAADAAPPCDRPNLSKDYLAGTAQPEWIPLRPPEFYAEHDIGLRLAARVTAIEPEAHAIVLADGSRLNYGALLLATGSEPVRLGIPGGTLAHVHVLRTLADTDAIIAQTSTARRCLVVGASFIGLEVAAALRSRGLEVHVAAPEPRPMERVMGTALGDMVRAIHEAHGVVFHLGTTVTAIQTGSATLSNGDHIAADLVVVGVGVQPALALATQAGLKIDRGVVVNEYLCTSASDIYAAGDIARWPDGLTRERIRVEHWVVAQRQGQTAARNMLGQRRRFNAVPFFWSQHYDIPIVYVGHAERWDHVAVDGDPAAYDCTATFWREGRKLATASVGRDLDSLRVEAAFEQELEQ